MALQRFLNRFVKTTKAHTEPTASFTTLVDLGKQFVFNHIIISNTYTVPVTLRFTADDASTHDFEVATGETWALDAFLHNGIIQYKYVGSIPSIGFLQVVSW